MAVRLLVRRREPLEVEDVHRIPLLAPLGLETLKIREGDELRDVRQRLLLLTLDREG